MSKLTALRKQISALEAEFVRTAKSEMDASVGKVKALMASLGVQLEHLGITSSPAATKTRAVKKAPAKAPAKRAGAGVPKYMDPKSGKTWTGFGRAPAWIEGAKNRDAFLVGKSTAAPVVDAEVAAKPAKKLKAKVAAPAKKATTRAVKKVAAAPAKKAAPIKSAAPAKKAAAKKPAAKKVAKKAAKKAVASANSAAADSSAAVSTAE